MQAYRTLETDGDEAPQPTRTRRWGRTGVAAAALLLLALAAVSSQPNRPGFFRFFSAIDLPDCGIDMKSTCEPLEGLPYGMQRTDQKKGGACVGIDGKRAMEGKDAQYLGVPMRAGSFYAACHTQRSGKWDCPGKNPCGNGGFCVDGQDKFTCVCPWGWEGKTCENDVNECRDLATDKGIRVCHADAECFNSRGRYSCRCRKGTFGDGYAVNQDKVKFGSILTIAGHHGWLVRPDANGDPGGRVHGVGDGRDSWGCHDTPPAPRCVHGTLGTEADVRALGDPPAGAPPEILRVYDSLMRQAKKQINRCASCDPGYSLDLGDLKCVVD